MDLRRLFSLGHKAKGLLANEAFAAAVKDVESDLIREWTLTKASDEKIREKLYLSVRVLHDVTSRLNGYVGELDFELAKQEQAKPE